jgi:hypothetical protein
VVVCELGSHRRVEEGGEFGGIGGAVGQDHGAGCGSSEGALL